MGNTCSTVDTPNAREDRFRRAGAAGSGKPVSSDDKPTGAYDASLRAAAPAAVNWSLAPHGARAWAARAARLGGRYEAEAT